MYGISMDLRKGELWIDLLLNQITKASRKLTNYPVVASTMLLEGSQSCLCSVDVLRLPKRSGFAKYL